jgi:SAM-dependent methyltransferase
MKPVELQATHCPICHTSNNTTELYPANFDLEAFQATTFSARRLPDRIHYRMVKCNGCGLVRSDPVVAPEVLSQLYAQSAFNYQDEIAHLKTTYGKYLAKLNRYGGQKSALLEIGCGNGFFLQEALRQGYATVQGIEPSADAIAKADPQVRLYILCDMMRPGLFETDRFDVICLFQVLDHLPDPGVLLEECLNIMKPGGLILCINHNIEAASAKLLKQRSPVIDIEHTYLYSPPTITRMFSDHHLQVKEVGAVSNHYTLYYFIRLLPLPSPLKHVMLRLIQKTALGRYTLSLPLGNLYIIAQKPHVHPMGRNE